MASTALTSALWFIAIIVMIPLALWLLKRSPAGARLSGAAAGGVMRHVAALPLSANQRVVTVEVGQGDSRRWLVLGVTAHNINMLYTIAPQADAPEAATTAMPGFGQLLGQLRGDKWQREKATP
jgi:flagellar protein FliO/FliZ